MQIAFESRKLNDMLDKDQDSKEFLLYIMDETHVQLGGVNAKSVKNFWSKTRGKTGSVPRAFFEHYARGTHSTTLISIREDNGALNSGKDLILSIGSKA